MVYLAALLFGLIGTGVMSGVLYAIEQAGAPLVRGIGSAIPAPQGGSLMPGTTVHVVGGLFFGLVYLWIGQALPGLVPWQLLLLGVGVGVLRAIVADLLLAMLAFDQDPLRWMAQAGAGVGSAHALGHVLYGLSVSVLFGLSQLAPQLSF